MDRLHAEQDRDQRLVAAMNAASKLAAAQAEISRHTWREPVRHLQARRALQEAEAARAKAFLPSEELGSLARRIIQLRLMDLRRPGGRYGSHRHPLHPEVDSYFDQLAADVAVEVADVAARPGALPSSQTGPRPLAHRRANELPELLELLSAPAVHAVLTRQRDQVREVAADTELFTRQRPDGLLIVQHAASGLRARFELDEAQPGVGRFGSIYAKHYKIASIDPSGAEGRPHLFEGLGIGAMIYRRAAAEYPDVRWRGGTLTEAAHALRRRLHNEDPYIWAAWCQLCDRHFQDGKDWSQRAREDFPTH